MKTMLINSDLEHKLKLMMLIVLFSVAPSNTLYYLITLMNQIIEICIKSALTLMKEYVYHVSFGVMYLSKFSPSIVCPDFEELYPTACMFRRFEI